VSEITPWIADCRNGLGSRLAEPDSLGDLDPTGVIEVVELVGIFDRHHIDLGSA